MKRFLHQMALAAATLKGRIATIGHGTIRLAILLTTLSLTAFLTGNQAQAQVPGSKAVPSHIQRAWIAGERVYIEVFVDNAERPGNDPSATAGATTSTYPYGEHYGNRLGDVIPMRVRIFGVLPPAGAGEQVTVKQTPGGGLLSYKQLAKIEFDFAPLRAGRLTVEADPENDPDWVFAKPEALGANEKPLVLPSEPTRVTIETPDGQQREADLWDIRLFVQTKRRPEPMLFWMEFGYCTELNPNGQRDWQRAETPDFIISGSYTGDKGRDLETGNTNLVEQERPLLLAHAFLGLGVAFILLPLGLIATRAIQRWLANRAPSPEMTPAKAWSIFDAVMAETKTKDGYAFEAKHVITVVNTFKAYIGYNGGVDQFANMSGEFDHADDIHQILITLERDSLEHGKQLSDKRYAAIMQRIAKLCPRP